MVDPKEADQRNFHRDPVEHGLWRVWYPPIASWHTRPYFKTVALKLNIGASLFALNARTVERYQERLKAWELAQVEFIASMEYHSSGAISARLAEQGDANGAEAVKRIAAKRAPLIESQRAEQESMRLELKKMLAESGLPTLLSEERYKPGQWEKLGDEPLRLPPTQMTIFDKTILKVKDLYAPVEVTDGFRLLCDRFPPRIHPKRATGYELRIWEGLPSTGLFDWFGHIPERWQEFQHYHHRQLHGDTSGIKRFLDRIRGGPVTLLHLGRGEYSVARSFAEYLLAHFPDRFVGA